ncbi:MAG TPA: efflux RND transporter periplasmic adaptor subunit [Acidobacteriota bacterium]|nr:efflux RND transporter periplasmic adaptor subunit [Acidobacteriota bacterium]
MKRLRGGGKTAVLLGLLALWPVGCGGQALHPEQQAGALVEAETVTLQQQPVTGRLEAVASVRSLSEATLSAQIAARIVSVKADEGGRVTKNQLLVELDPSSAQANRNAAGAAAMAAVQSEKEAVEGIAGAEAALEAARAQADLAQKQHQRFEELLKRRSVSQAEFDQSQARLEGAQAEVRRAESGLQAAKAAHQRVKASIEQARAALEQAEVMLGYTRVTAPWPGIITARLVEPGDMAHPGRPLLRLADALSFEALASLGESSLGAVSLGQEVDVEIEALGLTLGGKVGEIVPQADPSSRAFTVKVALPHHRGLRDGLFARVLFLLPPRDALILPSAALVRRGQLKGAFLVGAQGAIVFRLVETGREYEQGLEVLSGLASGDRVILNPGPDVSEGKRLATGSSSEESS